MYVVIKKINNKKKTLKASKVKRQLGHLLGGSEALSKSRPLNALGQFLRIWLVSTNQRFSAAFWELIENQLILLRHQNNKALCAIFYKLT